MSGNDQHSSKRRGGDDHGGGGGGHGGGSARWLITYADLISLLFVFFVVMYASSETRIDKLLILSDSIKKAMNLEAVAAGTAGSSMMARPTSDKVTSVSESIKEAAKALGIEKGISVSADERGIVISVVDALFFDPGSAEIKARHVALMKQVAKFVKETERQIQVEGHTDNAEIRTKDFPSNWELSTMRATNVVRFFINQNIQPDRISAVGYADTRPLVPNDSNIHRARNRRIDIVLMNSEIRRKKRKTTDTQLIDLMSADKGLVEREKNKRAQGEVNAPAGSSEAPPSGQAGGTPE